MVDSSDKRDFKRMNVGIKARFKINGASEFHEGTVADLSASGILLTTDVAITRGDELEVKVKPELAVVPPLYAKVEVLRVDALNGQEYRAGCKITELLS